MREREKNANLMQLIIYCSIIQSDTLFAYNKASLIDLYAAPHYYCYYYTWGALVWTQDISNVSAISLMN